MTTRARYVFSPWWRVAWFVGAILWLIVFNVVYISSGATSEGIGVLSILPIMAFLIDATISSTRWERARDSHQGPTGR